MKKGQEYYEFIKNEAEEGNPHAMLQLAKLYKSGVFQDEYDEEYIYWLKQFFSSPSIVDILNDLDTDGDSDFDETYYKSKEILLSMDSLEMMVLQDDIIEAGVSLGLYFMNCTEKEDLICARNSLYNSWIASRFAYLEVTTSEGLIDVLSILTKIQQRMEDFGYVEGRS